jgi:hypothetical protein
MTSSGTTTGATTLPRTGGGGGEPAAPALPAFLGLLLAATGLTIRRMAAR